MADLTTIREEIDKLLDSHMNTQESDGNESHSGRHQSDSNTDSTLNWNLLWKNAGDGRAE